ncbi:MAG TPA: hypothetical protein VD864_18080 [Nocardioides sp.]|nr:hypothetical protein [Nocardioides sp.]
MDDERVLNKLDAIEARGVDTLVAVTELKADVRDIPELKQRVSALEKWKWGTIGALAVSGSSMATTLIKAIGG